MDSNSSYDLDLTDVGSEELEKIASRIEAFHKAESSSKLQLSYTWERNHLMLDGKQWIVSNDNADTGRQWSEIRPSRANDYIPRPTTNYLFDGYQTLKAYLLQHKPTGYVRPNDDTAKNKNAAKVAELVSDCTSERLHDDVNDDHAGSTAYTYGTVFQKDYWDTTTIQMAKVPVVQEQPIIEPTTGAIMGYEEREVIDPETGEVVTEEMPLGDVNTYTIEPYRMSLDPLCTGLHNCRWIMESSIQPLGWIKQMYGKVGAGYTGKVDEIKPEKQLSNSLRRFFELKTSSGIKGAASGFPGASSGAGSEMIDQAAVVKEYYEAPTQENPKGRMFVVANGITLYSGPSPYEGPDLGDWHPYSEFRWEVLPGRFWGKTPLSDAVELQKRLNSIDATVILTRKTMAVPQKMLPKGCGIKRGEWTGRPGQQIEARPVNGVLPQAIPPQGVDPQVWKEREQVIEAIKDITGAIDVLKGDRPPGVTAASALEMLYEVGTGKLRPVLERWKKFKESSLKKRLKLVSKKYKEPRESFIRLLKSKNKELPIEAIENFIGEDLYDNCNFVIEVGSNVPKLESVKKAQLIQVANTGALQLEIPENRMQFLEDMGITGYTQNISPDVKRAEYENDVLNDTQRTPNKVPVVLAFEDHALHKEIHHREMKKPSFLSAPAEVQQAFQAHLQEHEFYIQQEQMQQQIEAMMSGQPPAPQGSPNDPQKLKSAGKGLDADTAHEVNSANIPPNPSDS